jgi:hypothetical protein
MGLVNYTVTSMGCFSVDGPYPFVVLASLGR